MLVDPTQYAAQLGTNFTSCSDPNTWWNFYYQEDSYLDSYGCWMSIAVGGGTAAAGAAMPPGCLNSKASKSGFLIKGRSYVVCGLSLWNEFFGYGGSVDFAVESSSATLAAFDSSATLAVHTNGVDTSACLNSDKGRGCAFDVASFCVECSSVDCSAVDFEVTPGTTYCESLNRLPCELVANECGP